ncbi:MAG: flippase [bacterium]
MRQILDGLLGREGGERVAGRLARGSTGTFGLTVVSKGLSFATGVFLARVLDASGYGAYSFAISWVVLLFVFAVMGMNRLLIREFAVYNERAEWGRMRGMMRRADQIGLSNSLLLALLVGGLAWLLGGSAGSSLVSALLVGLVLLPLQTLIGLRQSAMQGLEYIVRGQVPGRLVQPLLLLLLLLIVYLLDLFELTAVRALGLQILTMVTALIIAHRLLKRSLPGEVMRTPAVYETRAWVKSAMPLLLVGSMLIVNQRADVIMVGAILGDAPTGIYNAAARWAEGISIVLTSVNVALAPTLAAIHARGDMAHLQRVITRSTRAIFLLSVPAALVLFIFGYWLLLIFGPEYTPGLTALRILAAGHLFSASVGSVGALLVMTGRDREAALAVTVSGVLNIGLNAALIPAYGIEGAAVATVASLVVWNLIMVVMARRRLGILPGVIGPLERG